jgi:hypothetical protein
MRRRLTTLSACLAAVAAATICLGFFDPVTLTFLSVEVADLKDQRGTLWDHLKEMPPSRPIIKIKFSADADLIELQRHGPLNVYRHASICDDDSFDSEKDLQGDSTVYTEAGAVGDYLDAGTAGAASIQKGSANQIYHMYVELRPVARIYLNGRFDYDLQRNPADICVEIHGRTMFPSFNSFITTTLNVPKTLLIDALAQAKRK